MQPKNRGGRPRGTRKSVTIRMEKNLWDDALPKLSEITGQTRTAIVEGLVEGLCEKHGIDTKADK